MQKKKLSEIELNTTLIGDCRETLKQLPDGCINTCITSPPFYALRDYQEENQIGLEKTPDEYVEELVKVFREVKRVLREDGTLWLNLGDTYSSHKDCKSISQTLSIDTGSEQAHIIDKGRAASRDSKMLKEQGLKNKELIGIPWKVAFALREDGWYLRQDIIWSKKNSMPESVKDRCTKSHEYIFLMTKNPTYYYDNEAIKEEVTQSTKERDKYKRTGYEKESHGGEINHINPYKAYRDTNLKKNKRSVWTVATRPFKDAHFAVFPPDLIEPMVLAGCPEKGIVLDPFMGSGTTGMVAQSLGRSWIGCELNPEYVEMQRKRTSQQSLF
jgi:DNA modification methylase